MSAPRILLTVSVCQTLDRQRGITVWAMVKTFSDGGTEVATVGSDTMDYDLADQIVAQLNFMASDLDRAAADDYDRLFRVYDDPADDPADNDETAPE